MHIIDSQLISLEAVKPNRREGGGLSGDLQRCSGSVYGHVCVYMRVCKCVRVYKMCESQ